MTKETHSVSRIVIATPHAVFRAHVDSEVLVKWRPPPGMEGRLTEFRAKLGSGYRMELRYLDESGRGKTSADSDVVRVRFVELVPDEKIVEAVEFESDDPANAGTMTITTLLTPVTGGTKVSVTAENVPSGISEVDHRAGMESSLKNLALLVE
ncbi:SRPBCC domain-containing protein [Allosphingosinicella humi]